MFILGCTNLAVLLAAVVQLLYPMQVGFIFAGGLLLHKLSRGPVAFGLVASAAGKHLVAETVIKQHALRNDMLYLPIRAIHDISGRNTFFAIEALMLALFPQLILEDTRARRRQAILLLYSIGYLLIPLLVLVVAFIGILPLALALLQFARQFHMHLVYLAVLGAQRIDHIYHLIENLLHKRLPQFAFLYQGYLRQQHSAVALGGGLAVGVVYLHCLACLAVLHALHQVWQYLADELMRLVGVAGLHEVYLA